MRDELTYSAAYAARREAGGGNGGIIHAVCGAAAKLNNLSIETCLPRRSLGEAG